MAADYLTPPLGPPDYPRAWPTESVALSIVSGCNGLWAFDVSDGWCLTVIIPRLQSSSRQRTMLRRHCSFPQRLNWRVRIWKKISLKPRLHSQPDQSC